MLGRKPNNGHSGRGFTLAELIVVMLILGIVSAMVLPKVVGSNDIQARSAARIVMADLEYAQSQAIVTQAPVTVTFDTASNSYTVSNASGPLIHPITKNTYTVKLHQTRGMTNVSLASANFGGGASVTLDALGAPDNGGTVTVAAGPHSFSVTVAVITGRVTVARLP